MATLRLPTRVAVAAAAATLVLGLAACSDGDGHMGADGSMLGGSPAASSAPASADDHDQADVMFSMMMVPHHLQAIEMSDLVPSRSTDPELIALARQIKAAQQPEVDTMTTWLASWGAEPMMGHAESRSRRHGRDDDRRPAARARGARGRGLRPQVAGDDGRAPRGRRRDGRGRHRRRPPRTHPRARRRHHRGPADRDRADEGDARGLPRPRAHGIRVRVRVVRPDVQKRSLPFGNGRRHRRPGNRPRRHLRRGPLPGADPHLPRRGVRGGRRAADDQAR